MKVGFKYYNEKPVIVKPTIPEIIASLSHNKKVHIISMFVKGVKPNKLKHIENLELGVILHFYKLLNFIERRCIKLMESKTPPKNITELKDGIKKGFSDDFSTSEVSFIVNEIIKYSKYGGDGNWKFYSGQFEGDILKNKVL